VTALDRVGSRPRSAAVLGALAIASSGIFYLWSGVSPATGVFFRCLFGLPILLLVARSEWRTLGPMSRRTIGLSALAGVVFAVDLITFHYAVDLIGAGLGTVMGNLQVLIVGLAAWALFGERLRREVVIALPIMLSGVVLIYVFAVWLKWLPVNAMPPDGSPFYDRFYYLILPAIPLMFLELGYIARMARVGTVQVLAMPYIRTAVLKGLPRRRVIFGHVLRNAMVPTVTVIGSQVGWLIGGLVVIEYLFVYPGVGQLMVESAQTHDIPMLEASVLMVAVLYMVANLIADIVVALLNPRIRMGG